MGKCFSKNNYLNLEKITIEDYILNTRKRLVANISSPKSSQLLMNLEPVKKATIVDSIIEKLELVNLLREACILNSSRIYTDYTRYVEGRQSLLDNSAYIDIIKSQVSYLRKNLYRFPHQFSSKYLITKSLYERSIVFYLKDNDFQEVFVHAMIVALKAGESWVDALREEDLEKLFKKIDRFWKNYFENNQINNEHDLIMAKAKEGDVISKDTRFFEVNIAVAMHIFGFYKPEIEKWKKERKKYIKNMEKLCVNVNYSGNCLEFGALGLIFLDAIQ